MKQSGFEIIRLDIFFISQFWAHNEGLVHKIVFEIGFICILLVLIPIPAVQKLIIQSAMWILAGPFQVWGRFKNVLMLDIVRN